jgi:hypothetical protein
MPAHWAHRQPISWQKYRAWMQLARSPHDDAARFERDFGTPKEMGMREQAAPSS